MSEFSRQLELILRGVVEVIQRAELESKLTRSLKENRPLQVKAGFDPTAVDDDNATAGHLHFGKDVSREQDGVLPSEILNQLSYLADLIGIKTAGRLVENEQIGFMDKSIGKADALSVTFGKRADQFFLNLFQPAKLFDVAHALTDSATRHALERGAIIEVLRDPHIGVKRHVFRHVTETGTGLERFFENVKARDRRPAGRRRHEAREDPHRRAFAGPVRPEKAHDLALADFEVQVVDCRLPGVALGEIFDFDHAAVSFTDNVRIEALANFSENF